MRESIELKKAKKTIRNLKWGRGNYGSVPVEYCIGILEETMEEKKKESSEKEQEKGERESRISST